LVVKDLRSSLLNTKATQRSAANVENEKGHKGKKSEGRETYY
jgi:hypothetical protein